MNLKPLSNRELAELFVKTNKTTAEGIHLCCCIWLEQESRGVVMRQRKSAAGPFFYWRDIAADKLHPLAAMFASTPAIINTLKHLPLDQQERLALGEEIPLVVAGDKGKWETRMTDVFSIEPTAFARIVVNGAILTTTAQQRDLQARTIAVAEERLRSTAADKPSTFDTASPKPAYTPPPPRRTPIPASQIKIEGDMLVFGDVRVRGRDLFTALSRVGWHMVKRVRAETRPTCDSVAMH